MCVHGYLCIYEKYFKFIPSVLVCVCAAYLYLWTELATCLCKASGFLQNVIQLSDLRQKYKLSVKGIAEDI